MARSITLELPPNRHYNYCMMNKKYRIEEIGGMHGEILLKETVFDNIDFVMMYLKVNDIRDDNEEVIEKLEPEGWIEWGDTKDYVLNEGLMLVELKA